MTEFQPSEVQRILRQLEIPITQLPKLNDCLSASLLNFEGDADKASYKFMVMDLVSKLEATTEKISEVNIDDAGLIKADVLEWSENREKKISRHKDDLRQVLAKLIGYDCPLCSVENVF